MTWLRHRAVRGSTTLTFLFVGVPLLFFGASLGVDFTRVILAGREVSNAADAAAVAGAAQMLPRQAVVDEAAAIVVANESYTRSDSIGQTKLATNERVEVATSESSVTVRVTYDVTDLIFLRFFIDPTEATDFEVTRSADLCVPGEYDPTGGNCRRAL